LGADPKGKTILYTNGNSVFIRNLEVSENDLNQDKKKKLLKFFCVIKGSIAM